MALKIQWSQSAEQVLDTILAGKDVDTLLSFDNKHETRKLFTNLMEAIEYAADFPEVGRFIPEFGATYRELYSVKPFRVIYRIVEKELWVIGILQTDEEMDKPRFVDF